ncbi:Ras association domain-containing protein isoform 1 [Schistosoma japonicum]|uniref:Ras association domain-containing protein isoform 1 n=2 Tax=Schistosoma japonicum TaxID=6182 RepID=A0A4Z2D4Q6_SCHJA|nr:Ras association domain-containing protein isoform 1 [Schistosoma japonicum]
MKQCFHLIKKHINTFISREFEMNSGKLRQRNISVSVCGGSPVRIRRSESPQGRIKLSYFRHGSVSPQRASESNGNDKATSQLNRVQRRHSLVIHRKSPSPITNSCDRIYIYQQNENPTPTIELGTDINMTRTNNVRITNSQYERSMYHTTLTPRTNGIAIMIGSTNSTSNRTSDKILLTNDSHNSNSVLSLGRIGEPGLYDLGIPVDSNSISHSTSQSDNCNLNFSAPPCLSITKQPIVRCPVSNSHSISISVNGSTALLLNGNNDNLCSLYQESNNERTTKINLQNKNVTLNDRPPLPHSDTNFGKKGGFGVVRISATNSATALRNLPPKTPTNFSARNHSKLLHSSGSYENLQAYGTRRLSLTDRNHEFTKLRYRSVLTNALSPNSSQQLFHSSCDHYIEAMPNAQSMGIEEIKTNCSPQARLANPTMVSNTSDYRTQAANIDLRSLLNSRTPRNNNSPVRQNILAAGNKISGSNVSDQVKNVRSSFSGTNSQNYFRIQIPSTRAISRPKGFAMTDSLKLYEEQIFSHCQPSQRPQSWCLDFDQPRDENNPVDDSHSSSPASTVSSSFSSSSSSDTSQLLSQNHTDLRRIRNVPYYTPPAHPRNPQRYFHQNAPIITSSTGLVTSEATTPTSGAPFGRRLSEIIKETHPSQKCQNNNNCVPVKSINEAISSNEIIHHYLNTQNSHFNHSDVIYSNAQSESIQTNSSYDTVRPINIPPSRLKSNFLLSRPSLPLQANVNDSQAPQIHCPRQHSCDENYSRSAFECRKSSLNEPSLFSGDNNNNVGERSSPPRLTPSPIIFSSSVSDRSDNNSSAIPPPLMDNHEDVIVSPIIAPSTTTSSNNSDGDISQKKDETHSRLTSPTGSFLLLPPPVPWNLDVSQEVVNETTPSLFVDNSNNIILKNNHYVNNISDSHRRCQSKDSLLSDDINFLNSPCSGHHHNHENKPLGLSPTHHLDFDSFGISEMTDSNTYAFSTLDSDCLAWMRLSIRDVTHRFTEDLNNSPELQLPDLDTLSRPCVHHWVDIFNSNPLGLRLNFVDDSCRLAGTLRIYINLIKPVKMSLRRTLDMLPSSATTSPEPNSPNNLNSHENGNGSNVGVPTPPRLVSFFLPRGTSKVVYVTSSTTSVNAIQSLLDRFHIQESARKFALYEHTLENNSISARKLSTSECPLLLLLNWVRTSTNREQFLELLKQKRIVLQENDACDIEWKDFTTAELTNFLRILDKEESEYRNAILYQYSLLRSQLEQRMKQLAVTNHVHHHYHQQHHLSNESSCTDDSLLDNNTNGPMYSRYYSHSHPYSLEETSEDNHLLPVMGHCNCRCSH